MDLNKEQLACLESPTKASIVAALRALGQSSVKELSRVTGGRPDSLYYHLRKLAKVGLVQVAKTRPAETRPETLYELTSDVFYMRHEGNSFEYQQSLFRSSKNVVRLVQRHYEDALSRIENEPDLGAALRCSFFSGRLSKENLAKFKKEHEELLKRAMATHDPTGEPVMFAGIMAPSGYREDVEK